MIKNLLLDSNDIDHYDEKSASGEQEQHVDFLITDKDHNTLMFKLAVERALNTPKLFQYRFNPALPRLE